MTASIERARESYRDLSRPRRELLVFGAALLFGLLGVPALVWLAGQAALGDYEDGGFGAFLGNFFGKLAAGAPVFWAVVLGPYVFLCLIRLFWGLARRQPQAER